MKLSDIVNKLINSIPNRVWAFLALFIVIFASGPGMAFTYELLAFADLLGADIFVLAFVSGFLVLFQLPVITIKKYFLRIYCIPSLELIRKDKRHLLFLLYPNPSRAIEHFALASFVLCTIISTIYIPPWGEFNSS